MTAPMCEDGGPLREWAPLTPLLQQIPAKIQNGIFTYDINFTCIDAVSEFIAVGTNYGIIYWYNRETQDLKRLRCENTNSKIMCLRVISTVDYMVAAGNEHGVITLFQIPKNLPDTLPDSLKPKQKKQVERYSINGLHKIAVTAVEWSKNGMKLFSGDQNGLVVLTEIDFYMHLSKSSELLNEKYPIVQLSYQQGLLLVSTTLRTILVNRNENGKVTQVGQKERKTLGKLGAIFGNHQHHPQDLVIYASRPGLRLWQADKTGTVSKTLIFKDAVRSAYTEVPLLNPAPESAKSNRGEPTFGIVLPFCDDLLVTYSDDIIYVVNPQTIAITSMVTDLRRVTDVTCTKDEIFMLEGERNIIRIAYYPESNTLTSDSTSSFAEISSPVTTGLLELTSKLRDTAIVPAIPFHKINPTNIIQSVSIMTTMHNDTDVHSISNAEEAVEVPRVVPINLNIPFVIDTKNDNDSIKKKEEEKQHLRRQIFQEISQEEFEDILFMPEKKNKKVHSKTLNGNEKKTNTESDGRMNASSENQTHTKTTHSACLTLSVENDVILKSERNLETIQRDVENKEKLLADVLDLDLSKYMSSSRINTTELNITNFIDTNQYVSSNVHSNDSFMDLTNDEHGGSEDCNEHAESESGEDDVSYRTELKRLEDLGECRKKLLQNKLNEPLLNSNDLPNRIAHVTGANCQDMELQFNALSKESMTSAILEDEDWVLVTGDNIPSMIKQ